jgi:hypothetical protein
MPNWKRALAENYRLGILFFRINPFTFLFTRILLKSIYKIWSFFKVSLKSENSLGVIY